MEYLEVFMPLITEAVTQVFILIGTVAIGFFIAFIKRRTTKEQREIIESVFKDSVLFAQQVYGKLDGDAKFEKAKERALKMLEDKKIKLNEEQVQTIIESTLKTLKKEFGEEWGK